MKANIIILLVLFSPLAQALEFNRCVDGNGVAHYTNLPLSTLDANCRQKLDPQNIYLRYDYQRLQRNMDNRLSESTEIVGDEDNAVDRVVNAVSDALDADKALESLLENTQEARANPATEFFRARTEAVRKILEAD